MSPFPPNSRLSLWYDWAQTLGAINPTDFLARIAPLTSAHWAEFWPFAAHHGLAPWFYTHFNIQNSEFRIQNSEFEIQHSPHPSPSDLRPPSSSLSSPTPFGIQHSAFNIQHSHHSPLTPLLPLLKKHYLFNAIANIRGLSELAEILEHANAVGLPVIVLKGAHLLAAGIYSDPAERVLADIDILVHPTDLLTMQRIMCGLGYDVDENAEKNIIHFAYHHAEKKHVEVHYGLWRDIPSRVLDDFWQHATPFQLEGHQALMLAPADAFLHLAMHASYHHLLWKNLRSLLDLVYLTRSTVWQSDTWTKVHQRADEIGFTGSLTRLLSLTEQLLNTTLPGERNGLDAIPLDPQLFRDGCQRALATSTTSEDSRKFARLYLYFRIVRTTNVSERWAMLRSRLFPKPLTVAQACGIPNTALVWLHFPGYIFTRIYRLLMLSLSVMRPKRKNARLAAFESERNNDAAWGSLTATKAGSRKSEIGDH